jgi:hypothetical protein
LIVIVQVAVWVSELEGRGRQVDLGSLEFANEEGEIYVALLAHVFGCRSEPVRWRWAEARHGEAAGTTVRKVEVVVVVNEILNASPASK